MRDLRFRALFKHLKSKETIWLEIIPNCSLKDMDGYVQLTPWMQFTGLTDNNGKEIYEGDIVEFSFGHKAQVIFKEGLFLGYNGYANNSQEAYVYLTDFMDWYSPYEYKFSIEIIGNIHEHSHLL